MRNHLKSRQAGFTWYFAREALADALLTGRNKIFLSASKRQSLIFRDYIAGFADEWFGKEIKGQDVRRSRAENLVQVGGQKRAVCQWVLGFLYMHHNVPISWDIYPHSTGSRPMT